MRLEYEVRFNTVHEHNVRQIVYAKDRADAIRFIKSTYRHVKPKIVSARSNTKRKRVKPIPPPEPVLTEEQAVGKMLVAAFDKVKANPYDGKAIGNFFKLSLTTGPGPADIRRMVEFVIRVVDNHNEKFIQRKY